jgi:hypothetical protein
VSDRVTIPICPSESTPPNLCQSRHLTTRTIDNIAGTLKGNFGCSLDIERIRAQFAEPDRALSSEQIDTVKEVARVAVAACVGSLLHQNYAESLRLKSAESAAKERAQLEAAKVAAIKKRKADEARKQVDGLINMDDADKNRLIEALLASQGHDTETIAKADVRT